MTHSADLGLILATASSLLFMALGVWVLTLTPRRRQTKLLGAFAILFGLRWAQAYVQLLFDLAAPGDPGLIFVFGLFAPLHNVAALGLAASVPRPLEDRRVLGLALAVGFGFSTVYALSGSMPPLSGELRPLYRLIRRFVGSGLFWSTAALLALRAHPSQNLTRDETVQVAILAVGFGFYYDFVSGWTLPRTAEALALYGGAELVHAVSILGAWLAFAALWGRNMIAADDATVRVHRATMLAILALVLAGGLTQAYLVEGGVLADRIVDSLARTLAVGVLAYGVLRHDIAGLDAKVEYGVSRTTIAGVFVAVFFVAGELAETFFGEVLGPYAGVLAAGALVFVLSPLQRLADRLAAKAVPGGAEVGAGVEGRYRDAVRTALADGEITADEERHLGRLAAELGIDSGRAMELRQQVEDGQDGCDEP